MARSHTRRNSLQTMASVPTHTNTPPHTSSGAKSRRSTANHAGQGAISAALAASRAPLVDPALIRATEDAAHSASELREERSKRVSAEMELRDTRDSLSTVLADFAQHKSRSAAEITKLTTELTEALSRAHTAEAEASQTKTKLRQVSEMASAATAAQRAAARNAEEVSVAAQQSYRLFISTADRLSGITRELVSYKHILKRVLVSLFVSNFRKKQALRAAHGALVQATRCMRQELRKEVSASLNAGGGSGHSTTIDPAIELASPLASQGRRIHEFPPSALRLDSQPTVGEEDGVEVSALVAAGPTKRQSSLVAAFPPLQPRPRHITLSDLVSQVSDLSFGSVPLSAELTRLKAHWQASSDSFFTRTIELKSQVVDLQSELAAERSKGAGLRRRLQAFEDREAQAREAEANAAVETHPFLHAHSGQQRRHSVLAAAAAAGSVGNGSVFGSSSFAPPTSTFAGAPGATAGGSGSASVQSQRSKRGASWGGGHSLSSHESHMPFAAALGSSSSSPSAAAPPSNPRRSSAHRSLDASLGVGAASGASPATSVAAAGSASARAEIASVHEDQAAEAAASSNSTSATPISRLRSHPSLGPKIDTTASDSAAAPAATDHAHQLPLTPSPRSASHTDAAAPVSAHSGSGANGNISSRRLPRRSPYASPVVATAAASPSPAIHASPSARSIGSDGSSTMTPASTMHLPEIDSARKSSTAPMGPRHNDKRGPVGGGGGIAEETKQASSEIPRRTIVPFRGRGGTGDGGGGGAARRSLQQQQGSTDDVTAPHTTRDSTTAVTPHSPSPFLASHSAHGVASSTHGIYSQKQQRTKQHASARSRSRSPRKYTISRGKQAQATQQTTQLQATPGSPAAGAPPSAHSHAVGSPT